MALIITNPPLRQGADARKHSPQYHHIPCSAALDFSRTATPEPPKKKLKTHKHHHHVEIQMHITQQPSQAKSREALLRRRLAAENRRPSPFYLEELEFFDRKHGGVNAGNNVRRISSMVSAQSCNRPDWTEQDECGEADSVFSTFLKRSVSVMSFRSAAAEERSIMQSVREEDDASICTREGYGWNCVCFIR